LDVVVAQLSHQRHLVQSGTAPLHEPILSPAREARSIEKRFRRYPAAVTHEPIQLSLIAAKNPYVTHYAEPTGCRNRCQ
jgi:hypothetical protein